MKIRLFKQGEVEIRRCGRCGFALGNFACPHCGDGGEDASSSERVRFVSGVTAYAVALCALVIAAPIGVTAAIMASSDAPTSGQVATVATLAPDEGALSTTSATQSSSVVTSVNTDPASSTTTTSTADAAPLNPTTSVATTTTSAATTTSTLAGVAPSGSAATTTQVANSSGAQNGGTPELLSDRGSLAISAPSSVLAGSDFSLEYSVVLKSVPSSSFAWIFPFSLDAGLSSYPIRCERADLPPVVGTHTGTMNCRSDSDVEAGLYSGRTGVLVRRDSPDAAGVEWSELVTVSVQIEVPATTTTVAPRGVHGKAIGRHVFWSSGDGTGQVYSSADEDGLATYVQVPTADSVVENCDPESSVSIVSVTLDFSTDGSTVVDTQADSWPNGKEYSCRVGGTGVGWFYDGEWRDPITGELGSPPAPFYVRYSYSIIPTGEAFSSPWVRIDANDIP